MMKQQMYSPFNAHVKKQGKSQWNMYIPKTGAQVQTEWQAPREVQTVPRTAYPWQKQCCIAFCTLCEPPMNQAHLFHSGTCIFQTQVLKFKLDGEQQERVKRFLKLVLHGKTVLYCLWHTV